MFASTLLVMEQAELWTIGHSTRSAEEFAALLQENRIEVLADVRRFPGSRRYPHFNGENLRAFLSQHGITYEHFPDLGGRRAPLKDSPNTAWRNAAFRGYADYMMTEDFTSAAARLLEMAAQKRTAVMCAESLWWQCHRALVADYAKARGVKVSHILGHRKVEEHPYTSAAQIIDGQLSYRGIL
jgi:uncharacterized protein (DUF488 family)